MGDRYIIGVECPWCDSFMSDVYFAPTCGFTSIKCVECGHIIDLEEYTGISYEDASNREEIQVVVEGFSGKGHDSADTECGEVEVETINDKVGAD